MNTQQFTGISTTLVRIAQERQALRDAITRIIEADGDYYTDAPECSKAVKKLQKAIRDAGNILRK